MTLKEKCELWLRASVEEHISDNTYDVISHQLAKNYEKLPKWFSERIPKENLSMGTTLGIEEDIKKFYRDKFEV